MRGRWWLVAVVAMGAAWGQGVVVRPQEVEAGAKPVLVPQVSGGIEAIALQPGTGMLAVLTGRTVSLWNPFTGTKLRDLATCPGDQNASNSLAFSPNGDTLAVGCDPGLLIDMEAGKAWPRPAGSSPTHSVVFASDGWLLGYTTLDGQAYVLDDNVEHRLVATQGQKWALIALDPSGSRAAVATSVGPDMDTAVVYSLAKDQLLAVLKPPKNGWLRGEEGTMSFSPDGRFLAAVVQVHDNGRVRMHVCAWRIETGRAEAGLAESDIAIDSLAFSPDGRTLAIGRADGSMVLVDWPSRTPRATVTGLRGAGFPTIRLCYSLDGRFLVSANAGKFILRDPRSGQPLRSTELVGSTVTLLASAGGTCATASGGGTVAVWDLRAGVPTRWIPTGEHDPWCIEVSPNGRQLAIGGSEGTATLWDLESGTEVERFIGHRKLISAMAFRPDGRTLATASLDQTVILWDTETAQRKQVLTGAEARLFLSIEFSPDGRSLATNDGPTASLWDPVTARRTQRLAGHLGRVMAVAFSPDGGLLASSASEFRILLWRPPADKPVQALAGHEGFVPTICFSPDGRWLASGSEDLSIRVWDVQSGREARSIKCAGEPAVVRYLEDGNVLGAIVGGALHLFDARTLKERATLASIGQGAWFAATPEGYYDCSPGGAPPLVWRLGNTYYPFDQFSEKFNRPDLVRRALAGEDISNAPPLDATQLPPNLGFIAPQYGAEVKGDRVDVELQAAGKYPIRRLDLTVNGTPLPADLARQLDVDQPDQTTRTFKLTVPLPPNEPRVRLRAVAYDTESLKSRVEEVTLFRPGVKEGVGALHVLAVGINRYPKLAEQYQLRFAAPDAQAVVEAFGKLGGGRPYTEVKTKLLCDDQATVTNLKFALRELKDTATENDVAVLFVSGHGVADKTGAFYFPTCEVDLNDIPGTALSWQDFVGALREVRAKRVMVLADTCHSGAVVGQGQSADEQLAKRLNKEGHRLVFAASGRDEVSVGKAEWGHGAFSKALLEALEGKADGNKDGQVTFAELRDYVPGRVAELTENRQHPQLPFLDSFEPEAVLAKVR